MIGMMVASTEPMALSAMAHVLCCVSIFLMALSLSASCYFDVRIDRNNTAFVVHAMRHARVMLVISNFALSVRFSHLQLRAHGRRRCLARALVVHEDDALLQSAGDMALRYLVVHQALAAEEAHLVLMTSLDPPSSVTAAET